jgi:hypothetical protein
MAAEWRSDLSDFIDRELIEAATDHGVVVRPPSPSIAYGAFADPSGGRGDAFAVAIGHAEDGAALLDCLYERRAPFDPSAVVAEVAGLLRSYGVGSIEGDRYAAAWVSEAFSKEGIAYRQSERDRSAIYLDCLPLFTSGRARLLDNPRLAAQFAGLERRTSRAGKDRIDHGPGGADDVANAAAGALVMVTAAAAPAIWKRTDMFVRERPVAWPARSAFVFASAALDQRGIFVAFWSAGGDHYQGPPLVLVDYLQSGLTSTLFADVAARLAELAAMPVATPQGPRVAPGGVAGIICTRELQSYAMAAGLQLLPASNAAFGDAAGRAGGSGACLRCPYWPWHGEGIGPGRCDEPAPAAAIGRGSGRCAAERRGRRRAVGDRHHARGGGAA